MWRGGCPAAPRALAVPTGPLGSAGPPQTAETIFSCILERLTENWLPSEEQRDDERHADSAISVFIFMFVC